MINRYGDIYNFHQINENNFTIAGDLKHWRYGGKEGDDGLDYDDLGFVDPSGGPFLAPGMKIEGRVIKRISVIGTEVFFEVEDVQP